MASAWTEHERPHDAAAVAQWLPDGATVALGGAGLQRKPMELVRAIAEAGRRDLCVVSFLGSLDVELLLAAGCVAELHSAGVGLDGAGLAPRYRAAREQRTVRFVEWSEGTMLCAVEARARGIDSIPTWMGLGGELPLLNDNLRVVEDPFTGAETMQVRALRIDLALLHVPAIDELGHAYVDGDLAYDGAFARAAEATALTYETIRPADPRTAALSRLWIDTAIHAPGGAAPGGCHPHYGVDLELVRRWAAGGAEADPAMLTAEGAR
ncbi:MAG: CoA-transferase [Solirubrobacteraceae bacterium]